MNITYMPMGLPALANRLAAHGYETDIVHFGVEWIVDPDRSIVASVAATDTKMIGADLYWHYQTYDVLEVGRRIKAARPDVFFFLGGVTAGYFARQILEQFDFVDAVIRGDGEIAVVELAEAIHGNRELRDVANLFWRGPDGAVVENSRQIASTQEVIDELNFGDLSRLCNRETYIERFGFPLAYPKQFSAERNARTQKMEQRSFFPLFTGRGCAWECSFCGGNRKTLRTLMNTPRLRFRSVARVVDDIECAVGHGYQTMALCFDPTPDKDDYYVSMFDEIQRRKIKVDFYFECWGLPTDRFLRSWARTFGSENPHSYLALSPDAGNEAVRRRNKQPFYTDTEFYAAMDRLEEYRIATDVFFTVALPGETAETARDSARMIRRIRENYTVQKRLMTWSVQLEPGSSQFERPEDFNMVTDRKTLMDFYRAHGGPGADTYSALGYKILNYFGDERDSGSIADFEAHIQSQKCMEFCFFGENPARPGTPADGRRWCLTRRNELAGQAGVLQAQSEITGTYRYADAARDLAGAFPAQRPHYR